MPDGGRVGFYSDWQTGPAWERFHLTELPELLAAEYGAGERRAIAGVSMGGLGALGYAARHPGMFRAVGSFSGIVHTRLTPDTARATSGWCFGGRDRFALWGDPETDVDVWRSTTRTTWSTRSPAPGSTLSCGNGKPGPLDAEDASSTASRGVGRENAALAKQLKGLEPKPTSTSTAPAPTTGSTGTATSARPGRCSATPSGFEPWRSDQMRLEPDLGRATVVAEVDHEPHRGRHILRPEQPLRVLLPHRGAQGTARGDQAPRDHADLDPVPAYVGVGRVGQRGQGVLAGHVRRVVR